MSNYSDALRVTWRQLAVVLGYANAPNGALRQASRDRCDKAAKLALQEGYGVVLTGGFGSHFNTAPLPHCYYTRRYLLAGGLPSELLAGSV